MSGFKRVTHEFTNFFHACKFFGSKQAELLAQNLQLRVK